MTENLSPSNPNKNPAIVIKNYYCDIFQHSCYVSEKYDFINYDNFNDSPLPKNLFHSPKAI